MKFIEQNSDHPTLASVKRACSDFVKIVRVTGGWAVFSTWDEYEIWKNAGGRPARTKAKNPAAVALGRLGGRSRSPAKVAAVRANGAKGGRPPLPTLPIDGYDGNAPEIEFEGFRWAREDYGEYATVVGSRRLYLRATPGAGQTTARLYWIPATPGAEMQVLARGLAAVVHTIGHEADEAGVAQVFARDGELDVVWGEQTALHARSAELVDQTVAEFARRGWTVSAAGILHNLEAWSADLKSGYRDDVDGVHLFTPCGCNPFRVTASRLRAEWADWQTTYTA